MILERGRAGYRPEIDGLRAIAVLSVLGFHAGLNGFRGGYLGVDVFFVISGFLITGILVREHEQDRFSISSFYERRMRRILPALFVVLLSCVPFAWCWLPQPELREFSQSLTATALFCSNLFFWWKTGYFDAAAANRPLLHTWSLSVEEQYYIVFPLLVWLVWRYARHYALQTAVVGLIVSLILCQWLATAAPSANFYLAPTRAWELLTGSCAALANLRIRRIHAEVLALFGLAGILVPMTVYAATTPAPSALTIPSTMGTAWILMFASGETAVGRLLSARPLVGLGLISYSAYLWHQPVLVFLRQFELAQLPISESLAALAATLILAAVTYWCVEKPFRQKSFLSRRAVFLGGAIGLIAAAMVGLLGAKTTRAMLPYTSTPDRMAFLRFWDNSPPSLSYARREHVFFRTHDECNYYDVDAFMRGSPNTRARVSVPSSCTSRDGRKAVLIWGDSHAQALRPGLDKNLPPDWQVLQVASSGCVATVVRDPDLRNYCSVSNGRATRVVLEEKPDVVILAQNTDHHLAHLLEMRSFLLDAGVRRVILVGPSPHWTPGLPIVILRKLWDNTPFYSHFGSDQTSIRTDQELRAGIVDGQSSAYISLTGLFCGLRGCMTYLGTDSRYGLISADYGHLTPLASEYLSEKLLVRAVVSYNPKLPPPTTISPQSH